MAYADQKGMSTNRIIAIAIVLLLHVGLAYALVTGLAYEAVKNVTERLEVLDIEEEEPPEEEPPPPPPDEVVVAQPPVVAIKTPAPTRNTTTTTTPDLDTPPPAKETLPTCPTGQRLQGRTCVPVAVPTKTCWNGQEIPRTATCPPEPRDESAPARPRNNRARWVTTNDYPTRDLQRENQGTTSIRLTVGANGRATACQVTGSSGHPGLDRAACRNAQRRARFTPAKDKAGNPTTGSFSTRIRWQIPK